MKKRALFLFKNADEIEEINKFSKILKDLDIEIYGLYVKDTTKYDLSPTTVEGVGVQATVNLLLKEYEKIENSNMKRIKESMPNNFDYVYSLEGETLEILLEEMKAFDLVVIVRQDPISNTLKELLKYHYKPLIILNKSDREYSLDKILMLNDGLYKSNKSLFNFFNFFNKKVDVLRVNVEDKDRLKERFEDHVNIFDKTGDKKEIILNTIKEYDFLIMGDLDYSILFERIAGNIGIKIIENSKVPIFLG